MQATLTSPETSRVGLAGQVVVIVALIPLGLTLGALTGWPAMSPIVGMLLPLLAATWFLQRDALSWRDLGFAQAMPFTRFAMYTLVTLAAVYLLVAGLLSQLLQALGLPEQNISGLRALLEGNTVNYLLFLIPISWGSAAFGEELLIRGFLLDRLERLSQSPTIAVFAQAAIFALAHFYQGVTGVLIIFAVALIFGSVFIRCGRNLWPVIVAHGIIDSVAMTALYFGWELI